MDLPSTKPRSLLIVHLGSPLSISNMQFFFTLITFVALASAYQITSPGAAANWTVLGPNRITWVRQASTDPDTIDVLLGYVVVCPLLLAHPHRRSLLTHLPDSSRGVVPFINPELNPVATRVDGTLNFTIVPPSTGYPTGNGFQLTFVQDTDHSTILAQSEPFSIVLATTTMSS